MKPMKRLLIVWAVGDLYHKRFVLSYFVYLYFNVGNILLYINHKEMHYVKFSTEIVSEYDQ